MAYVFCRALPLPLVFAVKDTLFGLQTLLNLQVAGLLESMQTFT